MPPPTHSYDGPGGTWQKKSHKSPPKSSQSGNDPAASEQVREALGGAPAAAGLGRPGPLGRGAGPASTIGPLGAPPHTVGPSLVGGCEACGAWEVRAGVLAISTIALVTWLLGGGQGGWLLGPEQWAVTSPALHRPPKSIRPGHQPSPSVGVQRAPRRPMAPTITSPASSVSAVSGL